MQAISGRSEGVLSTPTTAIQVVVAVSAPHRHEAFEAARYCIDTLKATAPIWKSEVLGEGGDGEVESP